MSTDHKIGQPADLGRQLVNEQKIPGVRGGRGGHRGGARAPGGDNRRPQPAVPEQRQQNHRGGGGGRGGGRGPMICYNCHQPGHAAAVCPVRFGLVHEPDVAIAALEGLPAAAAIHILQPEAANPGAGDDPRAQREEIAAAAPQQVEDSEEVKLSKRLSLIADLRANLTDKAVTMLLTKEIASTADRKVVMQNLVQLARKEKMYTLFLQPQEELVDIYSAAVKKAFDLRLKTAKDLSVSRISYGSEVQTSSTSFVRGVKGLPNKSNSWDKGAIMEKPDLEILSFYESVAPFSLYKVKGLYASYYYLGLFLRLVFSLFAEKILHAFFFGLFAVRRSPGHRMFCHPYHATGYQPTFNVLFGVDYTFDGATKSIGGPAAQWVEEDVACRNGLTMAAAGLAFLILVTLELVTLSVMYKKWNERISDGILRVSFHAIDAFLVIGLVRPVTFSIGGITSDHVFDVPFYLSMVVFVIHLMWNSYCLFVSKQPHRCFSLIEALCRLPGCIVARVHLDVCLEDVPMKAVRTQAEFKVRRADPVCKEKVSIWCFWGLFRVIPTVYRSCSHNEVISMDGRVGKLLPAHESPAIFSKIKMNWKTLIRAFDRTLSLIPESDGPMDFYDWAATFPPRRRNELIRTRVNTHDLPPLVASSFTKREIAPKDSCDLVFKDPRFIQGCPLELSAAVGPTLRPWTKKVRDGLRPTGYSRAEIRSGKQIIYTCGLSNEAIGESFRRSILAIEELADPGDDVVFLEDDQSRFDLHLTEGPFRFLNHVYRKRLSRRVANLLKRSVSKGRSSLGTRYSIPHTMQSGWPDTSVGDTLVNAAMKSHIHGFGRNWISIICGDDSVTITTRRELERLGGVDGIINAYAQFGMEVEAKVSEHPLDVEFCSGRFFPANGTYVLFPKVGRIMSKIACDMKKRSAKDQLGWLRGIVATLKDYGRIDPVLGSLSLGLGSNLTAGEVCYDSGWEHKQFYDGTLSSTKDDVYLYYDHHYGSSSKQVDELAALMCNQRVGMLCHDTLAEHIALIDVA